MLVGIFLVIVVLVVMIVFLLIVIFGKIVIFVFNYVNFLMVIGVSNMFCCFIGSFGWLIFKRLMCGLIKILFLIIMFFKLINIVVWLIKIFLLKCILCLKFV